MSKIKILSFVEIFIEICTLSDVYEKLEIVLQKSLNFNYSVCLCRICIWLHFLIKYAT